jgi:nitrite reductase/ring-hydroxylating ferredoxin subunit
VREIAGGLGRCVGDRYHADDPGHQETRMSEFTRVAAVEDIPPGQGRQFTVGGAEIAVFNVAGAFHAISNICGHAGAPLAEGQLHGPVVVCPWHGWEYNVSDGKCVGDPRSCLPTYECKVQDGAVLVRAG